MNSRVVLAGAHIFQRHLFTELRTAARFELHSFQFKYFGTGAAVGFDIMDNKVDQQWLQPVSAVGNRKGDGQIITQRRLLRREVNISYTYLNILTIT